MKIIQAFENPSLYLKPDASLWRYMKLSTFLSLLRGTVFIPSLEKLGADDPKEGFLPWASPSSDDLCSFVAEKRLLDSTKAWLLEKATAQDLHDIGFHQASPGGTELILLRIWYHELQKRRAIWCWHMSDNESMAMWNVYAHQGIAIKTDPDSLCKSLGLDDSWQVLGGVLDYKRPDWKSWDYLEDETTALSRPFMFKSVDYEHEKEVRIVLKLDSREGPGMHIPIDPTTLLKEVVVSPFLLEDEQGALVEILRATFNGTGIKI